MKKINKNYLLFRRYECMLHLELYPKGTYKASSGFDSLLRDPTPFLLDSYGRPKETLIYDKYVPK